MLKTLSLTPEEAPDADAAQEANSESRMLRALNALSGNAAAEQDRDPATRTGARDATHRDGSGRDLPSRHGRQAARDPQRDAAALHQARARHRFVKDGEIPVVHMPVPRPRDAVQAPPRPDGELVRVQQGLDEQKLRADQAERARQEAGAQLRMLQTKLAHAEMALADAARLAEAQVQQIAMLQDRAAAGDAALAEQAGRAERLRASRDAASPQTAEGDVPRRGPGRPRRVILAEPLQDFAFAGPGVLQQDAASPAAEPEPVQWWLTPVRAPMRRTRRAG